MASIRVIVASLSFYLICYYVAAEMNSTMADTEQAAADHQQAVLNDTLQKVADAQTNPRLKREANVSAADTEQAAADHQQATLNNTLQKVVDAQTEQRVKREGAENKTGAATGPLAGKAAGGHTLSEAAAGVALGHQAHKAGEKSRVKRSGPGKKTVALTGAVAGAAAGGPLGAVAGGALGYVAGHKLHGIGKDKTRTV
ncbi:hypothetical protein RvY_10343 [Ramazzottius varieornatus]|uniref:Glycine zipper domain-containing protein n=1 Tax=Ramazzottius varieornatus TaxID=947166 RepID=A0A1D1VCG1_RAMVA|nr:hypothetical protein RvY_10343 [Ramazzottius varieornatus]